METTTPIERAAAELVVGITYATLPADALSGLRRLMIDQLGVQVGCATLPWSEAVLRYARKTHAAGNARTVLTGDRMGAGDAALVNASYGHGFEYDDAHAASLSHPGSSIIAAAVALGEEMDLTLDKVIEGVVAGYEAYTRIGTLAAPDILSRGFHPHAMLSPFGTAATAARMRGFDVETTLHALSIAYSHCSGTTEYTSTGGSVKRVHAGIGARNGIAAADMAEAGITGPAKFLTGAKGFFRTIVGRDVGDEAAQVFASDRPFEIAGPLFKPYCCCAYNHGFIDGARTLSGRTEDIADIELRIAPSGDVVVGNQNIHAYQPQQIEHLQYSLPFQFALSALGRGNGYDVHRRYMSGEVDLGASSDVAALAQKVRIVPSPQLDARFPGKLVADFTVTYRDGQSESATIPDSTGSAANPMSESDLKAKFLDLTLGVLGEQQSSELYVAINNLDPHMATSELVSHMCRT